VEEIYLNEFPNVKRHLKRNKKIQFNLKELEESGLIKIPREIDAKDYDECLKNWNRRELRKNFRDLNT